MISRRIIRTKVLQIIYAHVSSSEKTIAQSETELHFSIKKTYDLYHLLFAILVELSDFANERIESRKLKNFPTADDLNPNLKFVNNRLIAKLKVNKGLNDYLKTNKLNWSMHPDLIRALFSSLQESELYGEYISSSQDDFQTDRQFCEDIFSIILVNSESMLAELEEQSIYWNDDLDFTISMVIKTIKKFKSEGDNNEYLMSLYKDEEDKEFTTTLFRKAVINNVENRKIIETYTKNWDVDRVAIMDILIMQLALTELTEFPSIPIKVSLNEYIELAKYYSTTKSSTFINGVLDRITKDFKEAGKIVKTGRGLLES
ncbi:MAG: transcription antitermination factor NusB [Bacteroidia bacterium]|nr:transcription antitermination factor NusB [Bacteroidia bacterium]